MRIASGILLSLVFFIACNDEASQIGSDFFHGGSLNIAYVDTLTLRVSTVKYDSTAMSSSNRFLIGHHDDNQVGKITASVYFQIVPEQDIYVDEDFAFYSRTTLVLVPDTYSRYDTTEQITMSVYPLTEDMETDNGSFYNTTSFKYQETALGSVNLMPKPHSIDTLEIPLEDNFGNTLFSLVQEQADIVSDQDDFLKKYKGLAIIPGVASTAILGFGSSPEVRVYYWDKSVTPSEEKYVTFKSSYKKFTHIDSDRSGTLLSELKTIEDPLSSSLSGNAGFIQGGTGIALRVEIPYLKEMLIENPNLTITDAALELAPIKNTNRNMPLPENLRVNVVNYKNESYGSFESPATLIKDEYLGRDNYYVVDVRTFIMSQLETQETNKNAMLFSLSDQTQIVDYVGIGNQQHEKKMTLKIYCAAIDN